MNIIAPTPSPSLISDINKHSDNINDINHTLGTIKLLIQQNGLNVDSLKNIPSDSAGIYMTLRDNLSKETCGVYARINRFGYKIEKKITHLSLGGFDLILEIFVT
ncbi:hypothetical protein CBF23_008565 [Marinomonas agarivorans]|nr:hypothetical protein CBF23_008565 [Marinomonas agarivorans]